MKRVGEFQARLRDAGNGKGEGVLSKAAATFEVDFRAALDDDLNAPRACGALFEFVHQGNAALNAGSPGGPAALATLDRAMAVLDVLPTAKPAATQLEAWIRERVAARDKARKSKDFREADRIRAELATRGVEIEDTPSGTKWRLV